MDKVNAYAVTLDWGTGQDGKATIGGGIDSKKVATLFREMADKIDAEQIFVNRFTVLTKADREEFCLSFLRLSFLERTEVKHDSI